MDAYGDLECWYAEDDEGNGYHTVYFSPSLRYIDKYNDIYSCKEVEDEDLDEVVLLKKICVVN